MSHKIEAKKLKGFRDFSPEQAQLRKILIDKIWHKALTCGYQPIMTPALEYAATLVGSGGGDSDKEVYHFTDHGEREVALRFDLTVPFARYVAENRGTLTLPFKKLQIGDVWRGEKPQKGRYREFCQADVDIIGVDSIGADVEIIACLSGILTEFSELKLRMAIGNRVILSALIKSILSRRGAELESEVIILIDKLSKIGVEGVIKALQDLGFESDAVTKLIEIISSKDANGDTDLSRVEHHLAAEQTTLEQLKRYQETLKLLKELKRPNVHFLADLSLARGLGYYTGIVFETTIEGLSGFGSISGGGRYNQLVSRFTAEELPGVGGSIGVDRFVAALEELKIDIGKKPRRDVFVALLGEDARAYAMSIVEELRAYDIATDLGLKPQKVAQQFRYADRLGYSFVAVVGSDECSRSQVTLKTLATGNEEKGLGRTSFASEIKRRLS